MDKLSFSTIGVNIHDNGKPDEIATPIHICNDMTELFPSESFENNKVIWGDIYCKTGNTLKALKQHGVSKENIVAICPTPQCQLFVCRQLYGKLLPEVKIDKQNKYPDVTGVFNITRRGQVYYISNWKEIVTGKVSNTNALTIINKIILNEMRSEMSLEFTSENGFKFNNIIMNPPYNNDMYLDFVTLAHKLATDNVVAITPAKWQAKGGAKNAQFRKDIVPYISEVIMYHDCKELFDIQETSGISAYLVSKEVSDTTVVTNKCSANSTLNDITEVHYEKPVILYPTNYINILNKCRGTKCIKDSLSFKRCVFVGEQERGYSCKKFSTDVDVMQGNKHVGYMPVSELFTTENLEKYKCTSLILISMQVIFNGKPKITGSQSYGILKPNQVPKGSFPCVKYFDTEEQCKSFKSYMESKLMSFLFFCGVCGGTLTAEFYRFVPAPKAFDHIFTDQELYKKYNLTDEEINIIESVIKERK